MYAAGQKERIQSSLVIRFEDRRYTYMYMTNRIAIKLWIGIGSWGRRQLIHKFVDQVGHGGIAIYAYNNLHDVRNAN